MALKLSAGEQKIFEGHPSWRAILGFYLKGILTSAVLAALVGLVTRIGGDEVSKAAVAAILIAGIAITILAGLIKRIATTYTITNRRLHIKRGIISREIQETRLERVQNVNYSQSVYERIMQIGSVDFDTAAGDDYEFRFLGVGDPEDVVHEVDKATSMAAGGVSGPPAPEPPPAQPTAG